MAIAELGLTCFVIVGDATDETTGTGSGDAVMTVGCSASWTKEWAFELFDAVEVHEKEKGVDPGVT
jgi:hypothetical protein